jgi:GNAT superfamily N-acetyltransferase
VDNTPATVSSQRLDWGHRFIEPGDEPELLALIHSAFTRWPPVDTDASPLEYLRWKLSSQPAEYLGLAATSAGRIIGVRLYFTFQAYLRGTTHLGYQPVDAAVHPSFRRMGVMEYMRRFEVEAPDVRSRFGIFAFKLHIRTWNPAMQRLFRTLNEALETSAWLNIFATDRRSATTCAYTISSCERFDQRFDELWHEAAPDFDLAVVRDSTHLNWRYADRRAGYFHIITAERNGALLGYAVAKVSQGVGYIADMLAPSARRDVLQPLAATATDMLLSSGAKRVECWLPAQHPYADELRGLGFTQRKQGPRIRVTPYSIDPEELLFLQDPSASIYMTIGDTDLV